MALHSFAKHHLEQGMFAIKMLSRPRRNAVILFRFLEFCSRSEHATILHLPVTVTGHST